MKHLCDLPTSTVRSIFKTSWFISEKIDGSYLRAGLDDDGRFYTTRKGHYSRYYSVNDWPMLAWTNAFRVAHLALEEVFNLINTDFKYLNAGDWIDAEVVNGCQPNAILYPFSVRDTIFLTASSIDLSIIQINNDKLFGTSGYTYPIDCITICADQIYTSDGKTTEIRRIESEWNIIINMPEMFDPAYLRGIRGIELDLPFWLDQNTQLIGLILTNEDALNLNLKKRPQVVSEDDWSKHRSLYVNAMRELREKKRTEYEKLCNLVARVLKYKFQSNSSNSSNKSFMNCEGIVAIVPSNGFGPNIVFKMVDKEQFAPLNHFAHIVRYWLQGGSRPPRPSFMSRTKDWPVQRRLERLEVLRQRYLRNRSKIQIHNRFNMLSYASCEDLHNRTLLLFAELKERIISDGRSSIQIEDTQDSETGNPANN